MRGSKLEQIFKQDRERAKAWQQLLGPAFTEELIAEAYALAASGMATTRPEHNRKNARHGRRRREAKLEDAA